MSTGDEPMSVKQKQEIRTNQSGDIFLLNKK